jgi:hypothetical protein
LVAVEHGIAYFMRPTEENWIFMEVQ